MNICTYIVSVSSSPHAHSPSVAILGMLIFSSSLQQFLMLISLDLKEKLCMCIIIFLVQGDQLILPLNLHGLQLVNE